MRRRTPEQLLASGCVTAIAEREEFSKPRDYGSQVVLKTSQKIGRTCLRASKGKAEVRSTAKETAIALGVLLEEKKIPDPSIERKTRLFQIGSKFIAKPHLHRAPEKLRHAYQAETIRQIGELLEGLSDTTRRLQHPEYLGELCELTTIGLINRERSPDFMAIAAPPHHDFPLDLSSGKKKRPKQKNPKSYDVLFVHNGWGSQALQVKRACQNFCDKPERSNSSDESGHYAGDIAMISGHCDLGVRRVSRSLAKYDLTVPQLLVADQNGLATGEQKLALDERAEALVLTILEESRSKRAGAAA